MSCTFFVDGRLTKEITDKYPYAFSSFQAAVRQLKDGTPDAPMTIYRHLMFTGLIIRMMRRCVCLPAVVFLMEWK